MYPPYIHDKRSPKDQKGGEEDGIVGRKPRESFTVPPFTLNSTLALFPPPPTRSRLFSPCEPELFRF